MEDFITFLVFAVFLWSVIGGAIGKKRQGNRPTGRAPGPTPTRHGPRDARRPEARDTAGAAGPSARGGGAGGAGDAGGADAAVLVPDDLWEILTGERRRPAPVPTAETDDPWGPEFEEEEIPEPQPTADDRAIAADPYAYEARRPIEEIPPPVNAPVIVSLEGPPPPPARRHAAFHERLDATRPTPRPRPPRPGRPELVAAGRSDIQRAIVLREVLGPPKGLED